MYGSIIDSKWITKQPLEDPQVTVDRVLRRTISQPEIHALISIKKRK